MMFKKYLIIFVFMIAFAACPSHAISQDSVKPPKEDASLAELEKWLVQALGRHASYSTRSTSFSVEKVKVTGCTIGYSVVKRSSPANNDTVNPDLKTKGVKSEVDLDAARIDTDGIEIVGHVLPELQRVIIHERFGPSVPPAAGRSRAVEIVVKYEAAAAIKTALERFRDHCVGGG